MHDSEPLHVYWVEGREEGRDSTRFVLRLQKILLGNGGPALVPATLEGGEKKIDPLAVIKIGQDRSKEPPQILNFVHAEAKDAAIAPLFHYEQRVLEEIGQMYHNDPRRDHFLYPIHSSVQPHKYFLESHPDLSPEVSLHTYDRLSGQMIIDWNRFMLLAEGQARAVQALHNAGYLHLDVSLRNFLYMKNGVIDPRKTKLIDLLHCQRMSGPQHIAAKTPFFAPEEDAVGSVEYDTYSLARCYYWMLTCKTVYQPLTEQEVMNLFAPLTSDLDTDQLIAEARDLTYQLNGFFDVAFAEKSLYRFHSVTELYQAFSAIITPHLAWLPPNGRVTTPNQSYQPSRQSEPDQSQIVTKKHT